MMSMYLPLELLTIKYIDLPQSNALQRFLDIAWDGYDSIDSEWDSCTVGCAIPILENTLCGGINGLKEFDWNQDYCHDGKQNDKKTICCDKKCIECSQTSVKTNCNSDKIAVDNRECISALDVECVIPKDGDGAVCEKSMNCKSALCKNSCCNVSVDKSKCAECGPLGGNCIKCKKGFKLENSLCVDECACSAGCTDCNCGICNACDSESWFLKDEKCQLKRGDGKQCNSDSECLTGSCFGGYCCKESVYERCDECNNRGNCALCQSGFTLCGHHEADEGFCKPSISYATTTFRCGTGGDDTDYPSSDGYNYCGEFQYLGR